MLHMILGLDDPLIYFYENQFYQSYLTALCELVLTDDRFYSSALGLDPALTSDYRLWIRQIRSGSDTGRPEINRLYTILFSNRNSGMLSCLIYPFSVRKFANKEGQGSALFWHGSRIFIINFLLNRSKYPWKLLRNMLHYTYTDCVMDCVCTKCK